MENTNSSSTNKAPTLCTAGCGFYGSEAFNNMCSQCFKAQNKTGNNNNNNNSSSSAPSPSTTTTTTTTTTEKSKILPQITKTKISSSPPKSTPSTPTFSGINIPLAEKSRKHLRSPSPNGPRMSSAPASSIASPAPSTNSTTDSIASTSATTPTNPSDKPAQLNKGRCFKCRLKVPLAKQAANKCRCGYVFCDSHRYPDRHDCDIDYAKMDREILAKNNPKLHERPRGGRSFNRIDSL